MNKAYFILILFITFNLIPTTSHSFELIAHRGIYQNYEREEMDSSSCTAIKILPPTHNYIENTIPSITKAFDIGADYVELDIHPTTEQNINDDKLIVFHDWELTCRTNAKCGLGCICNEKKECITDQQSWDFLKTLDIGFGYTTDGKTFPFRGTGVGLIPTFKEVVSLLLQYPLKKLLVNVKDTYTETQLLLLSELANFPKSVRSRVYVEFQKEYEKDFLRLSVPEAIWQSKSVKKCFIDLIMPHPIDTFPESCKGKKYFIPLHQDKGFYDPKHKGTEFVSLIPCRPDVFLRQASENSSEIYLSQVNTELDFNFSQKHTFKGIMTDRIELIAPMLNKQ